MRRFYFMFFLIVALLNLQAQNVPTDKPERKFSYLAGVGVSSQYDAQISPYFRAGATYKILPKVDVFGELSYTNQSLGDTFTVVEEHFTGQPIEWQRSSSSVFLFSMMNLGFGVKYRPHPKVALRTATAFTKIISGNKETRISKNNSSFSSTFRYPAHQLSSINHMLFGTDLGVDFTVYKRIILGFNTHLRFTDVSKDAIYGPQKNRIAQSTLSINYLF